MTAIFARMGCALCSRTRWKADEAVISRSMSLFSRSARGPSGRGSLRGLSPLVSAIYRCPRRSAKPAAFVPRNNPGITSSSTAVGGLHLSDAEALTPHAPIGLLRLRDCLEPSDSPQ
jgi:hypothetical protein